MGAEGGLAQEGPALCPWLSHPQLHLRAHAAYGSTKDVAVYNSISLSPMHIYIVGRPTKKLQQQCQVSAAHRRAHVGTLGNPTKLLTTRPYCSSAVYH